MPSSNLYFSLIGMALVTCVSISKYPVPQKESGAALPQSACVAVVAKEAAVMHWVLMLAVVQCVPKMLALVTSARKVFLPLLSAELTRAAIEELVTENGDPL